MVGNGENTLLLLIALLPVFWCQVLFSLQDTPFLSMSLTQACLPGYMRSTIITSFLGSRGSIVCGLNCLCNPATPVCNFGWPDPGARTCSGQQDYPFLRAGARQ